MYWGERRPTAGTRERLPQRAAPTEGWRCARGAGVVARGRARSVADKTERVRGAALGPSRAHPRDALGAAYAARERAASSRGAMLALGVASSAGGVRAREEAGGTSHACGWISRSIRPRLRWSRHRESVSEILEADGASIWVGRVHRRLARPPRWGDIPNPTEPRVGCVSNGFGTVSPPVSSCRCPPSQPHYSL